MGKSLIKEEMEKLEALPVRSIITGETWHDEVYQKTQEGLWHTVGSSHAWFSKDIVVRGPFVILRRGEAGP